MNRNLCRNLNYFFAWLLDISVYTAELLALYIDLTARTNIIPTAHYPVPVNK